MQKQPHRNILTIIPSEEIKMGESVIGFLISCLHFYHCLILHTDNMIKSLTDLIYDFLRHLWMYSDAPWVHLINYKLNVSHKMTIFRPATANITNPFWKDVLDYWQEVSESCLSKSVYDIIVIPLWYNKSVNEHDIFDSEWYEHGVRCIGDVLSERGYILSREDLQKMYNLRNINLLDYYKIDLLIRSFMNKYVQVTNKNYGRVVAHFIPFHVKKLFKSQKGAGDMYKILNNSSYESRIKNKWNHVLNEEIDESTWQNIFEICFRFGCDASLT